MGDPEFGRNFLPSAKQGDEESTIKAFAQSNKEGALKVRPKVRKSLLLSVSLPAIVRLWLPERFLWLC